MSAEKRDDVLHQHTSHTSMCRGGGALIAWHAPSTGDKCCQDKGSRGPKSVLLQITRQLPNRMCTTAAERHALLYACAVDSMQVCLGRS
jgi:hypothetical protein